MAGMMKPRPGVAPKPAKTPNMNRPVSNGPSQPGAASKPKVNPMARAPMKRK